MRYAKNIIFLMWMLLYFDAAAITFRFKVPVAANTSAGVYKNDGTLIRTLWSGVRYKAGTYTGTWDGVDDESRLAANGNYKVKVLSNNVKYQWEGVIGNNSDSATGSTVYHSMNRIHSMAFANGYGYFCRNQSEGIPSQAKFSIDHPQTKLSVLHSTGTSLSAIFNCTDGINMYWGGNDAFGGPQKNFVYATQLSNDNETLFPAGVPVQATYGRAYASVIDYVDYAESTITGMAVQKQGNLLFVSHYFLGVIRIFNKTTGALVNNMLISKPVSLVVDANDELWVSYSVDDTARVEKFHPNSNGTLATLANVLPGLEYPVAIAVSPDNNTITVADAGTSQQVKAYSNQTGAPLWTMGQQGGYANGPEVTDNKFYFSDIRTVYGNFIAYQPDGSFWVGDPGNNRSQHFSTNRTVVDCIMYLPNSYCMALDANKPERVFSDYLEFKVDYSKPLAADNGSWKLVKNWGATIPNVYDNAFSRLKGVVTLSNDKTYMLLRRVTDSRFQVVELSDTGNIRFTGNIIDDVNAQLYPDGSIRSVNAIVLGTPTTWTIRQLSGFDNLNNPIWPSAQPIASSPPATRNDPLYWGNGVTLTSGEMSSASILVSFDGGLSPNGSDKWHLGGIKKGTNKWLWRTAISTKKNYTGPFPQDGAYDNGNGSQYAGSIAMVKDHNIFWGFHGEFWKQSQTNMWNQVYDDGLFVGQFGVAGKPELEAAPGMAGNSFSAALTSDSAGNIYLFHNDESYHGGIHRWKVTGLETIKEDSVVISFQTGTGGLLGEYYDATDLNNMDLKTTRIDSVLDFDWHFIPTNTNLSQTDNYSVGWKGFVQAPSAGNYTFHVSCDRGVRVWVDGKLIINKWLEQGGEWSGQIEMETDIRYGIRIEYKHTTGNAGFKLQWSNASFGKTIVPASQLTPCLIPDRGNGIDLMENLNHNSILENNMYGWKRLSDEEDYTSGEKWWSVSTSQKGYDSTRSPDVFIKFRQASGQYTLTRDLGSNSEPIASWNLVGQINYEGNTENTDGGGSKLEVLDMAGKVIIRLYTKIIYGSSPMIELYANEQLVATLPQHLAQPILTQFQNINISLAASGATFSLGPARSLTVPIVDAAANWRAPKTLRLSFWTINNNYDRIVDIKEMHFSALPYKLLCNCNR